MSVIVENVELFKDFNFSDSWNKDSLFDKDGFKVEFNDGKARVYGNIPFSKLYPDTHISTLSFSFGLHKTGKYKKLLFW